MVVGPQAMASLSSSSTTAIVFARLDPILKRLLEGLTRLKNLLPFLHSGNNNNNNDHETAFVRLSKSIAEDLESLSKDLVVAQQHHQQHHQQNQRLQHAKALCLLAKYITLPLNAVFRLPLREIYDTSERTADPKLAIRRSYVYRMYRQAAIAMQKFIEETTIDDDNTTTQQNSISISISHNLLPTTTWIEHLVALINVMPTYEETISKSNGKTTTNSSLDDGTNVFCEILSTTRTLCKCFDSNALLQAWHGTLSMRLVDSLTAFLVQRVYSLHVHTAALETLAVLFQVTTCDETSSSSSSTQTFWRSVFPGVFTALYKIIANDAASNNGSTTSMVQIFNLSLKSLISLLKITLSSLSSDDDEIDGTIRNSIQPNSNDDLLAKLNSMVVTANNNKNEEKEETTDEKEPSQKKFFYQVRKKIEGPLMFVLRHLSVSPNDEIRRNVVRLCHVILLETHWRNSNEITFENPMEQVPLELCIGFQQDPDASVREAAKEIIDRYSMDSSPSAWMVPRVIELIQKLFTLVHRGRSTTTETGIFGTNANTELRTHLNLVAGYLQCLDRSAKESRAIASSICNSFVASKQLRSGLIQLFGVDLDSLNGKIVVMDYTTAKSPIKLVHLDHPELMVLAKDSILRSLGRLLGPKHGAIFVDEIVSDFLEASFQMPKTSSSGWLNEWLGSLIVAKEVLWGSFSVLDVSSDKKEKRRRRILLSLASSILPLLVDCSLWNLPLENQIQDIANSSKSDTDLLSPQTLQRNQIVVILLMEVIGVFSQLLRGDLKEVLVTVFYPVVEKTTRRGSDIVQQTGLSTLKTMSLSCGLQNTENLIHAEQNRLIAGMIGRLRLPGGSRIPKSRNDAEEILSVTKTSIWVLEMINRGIDRKKDHQGDSEFSKNSAVMDLVALLNYRLDHLFLQNILVDSDVETVCSLHKAFFNYFLHIFHVNREASYSYQMKHVEKDSKQPWLDLLSQFRKIPLEPNEEAKESEGNLLDFARSDITLFEKLIGRDCYLLSYQKLETRISSCDALTLAFKFLAFVGSEHDDPNDDTNVIRNTILRQVADSWPSIRARLKSLSDVILHSYSGRRSNLVLVLNQSNATGSQRKKPEDIGTQRIFLSKLFQLIATMCECSGDFFADRFRNDVWPVMARHLKYLLEELQRQRETQASSIASGQKMITTIGNSNDASLALSSRTNFSFKISETQGQLIASILKCLNRILEQEDCGKAVKKLLDSIGSTLLPLLDIEDQTTIQELSMDCIRSILKIDSDVLRRPLVELSGTKIPPCPLKFKKAPLLVMDVTPSLTGNRSTMGNRCHELLAFADSLPEQAI